MRNEFDYAHERPSRLSRLVVLFSTLGVALIAAWVFTPILLANYTAHTATSAAKPVLPETVREPVTATASVSVVRSAAASAAPPPAAAPGTTTALASRADDAAAPPRASATPPAPSFGARTLIPWPGDQPPTAPPVARATPADTRNTRVVAISATTDPIERADNVPLPRSRPSRRIAAYLAIPLPRPRPEIVSENTPPSRPTTFDLQIERLR
jgi:hypothetical protein